MLEEGPGSLTAPRWAPWGSTWMENPLVSGALHIWAQHISSACQCLTGGCGATGWAHSEDIEKLGMVQKGAARILKTCCETQRWLSRRQSRKVPPERADSPGSQESCGNAKHTNHLLSLESESNP